MSEGVTLRCRADGPYVVTGPIRLVDSDGSELAVEVPEGKKGIALCRCGRSSTRPFCDGSHREGGDPPKSR